MKTDRHKSQLVPNLRFPGFEGEWREAKLGESCRILMCKRILAAQTNPDGGVPFYKIGTVGGVADAYISQQLFESYRAKYNYPKKGEILITCAGTVGKSYIFNGEDSYFQDSNIVWVDNPTELIQNSFLFYLLSIKNWGKLNSTTITRIYNDNLKALDIVYPGQAEQQKIISLLTLIDSRLSTQNKIIEQLESLIKGLCRILIISKTPNTKIKSCLECHSSTLSESDIEEDGGICNVYGATGVIAKTSKYQIDKSSILIIKDGAGVGRVQYAEGRYSVLGTLNYLTAKNGYFLKYLYYFLSIFNFGRFVVGSGIPHIYFKDYGEAECYCPSLATQYKIANALTAVTEKIEIERRLLQKMKEQKQYLISNLFI